MRYEVHYLPAFRARESWGSEKMGFGLLGLVQTCSRACAALYLSTKYITISAAVWSAKFSMLSVVSPSISTDDGDNCGRIIALITDFATKFINYVKFASSVAEDGNFQSAYNRQYTIWHGGTRTIAQAYSKSFVNLDGRL